MYSNTTSNCAGCRVCQSVAPVSRASTQGSEHYTNPFADWLHEHERLPAYPTFPDRGPALRLHHHAARETIGKHVK
eukprot:2019671-Alexandrium_andersonii.AAC.1